MGDQSGAGKSSIPSWQLPQQPSETATQEAPAAAADNPENHEDRESLLNQGSQFLQDESIRDAPTDRKISFLESKGLRNDDIQKLLGVSRNPETSDSKATDTEESSTAQEAPEDTEVSKSSTSSPPQPSSSQAPSSRQTRRSDVPPVITYPEFLYQAQTPPPLVSLQSVLYTLYAASGVAASIYGASEFLIKPMVASLNGARHDFAEGAEENLRALNEKIEKNVSVVPEIKHVPQRSGKPLSGEDSERKDGLEDDVESVTSDPTELFHRDIATQTTPDLGEKPSSSEPATAAPDGSDISNAEKAVNKHVTRLQKICSELNEAQTKESGIDAAYSSARDRVSELQTYLDSLAYSSPTYLSSSLYGFPQTDEPKDGRRGGMTTAEEDAISGFKGEIRSVKGTLLSAKNFPSGSAGSRMKG